MKNKKLMLSYGSNMSIEQMAYRCPEAEIIGTAIIKDYRLMYKGSRSGAYATIEPEAGQKVPVLVWAISEQDEKNLDRYEGFPTFYYKKNLEVEVRPISNETPPPTYGKHKAMVYIMDESRGHGIPSTSYEAIIKEGYRRFGFDTSILTEAMRYTKQHIPSEHPAI